MKIDFPLIHEQ